jgi:hypothetical protein
VRAPIALLPLSPNRRLPLPSPQSPLHLSPQSPPALLWPSSLLPAQGRRKDEAPPRGRRRDKAPARVWWWPAGAAQPPPPRAPYRCRGSRNGCTTTG